MTSNVLPLHFAPSQASSSQNSNVDNFKLDCHNPFIILKTLKSLALHFSKSLNLIGTRMVLCSAEEIANERGVFQKIVLLGIRT